MKSYLEKLKEVKPFYTVETNKIVIPLLEGFDRRLTKLEKGSTLEGMQINISLTEEQKEALLSQVSSIEEYVQEILEKRANNVIMQDGC